MLNRHQSRLKLIFALYKSLLLNKNIKQVFITEYEEEPELLTDEYINTILEDINNNLDTYIKEIEPKLVKWSFDRLDYLDQAILIASTSEIKTGINKKSVVIDEAVIIAKEYLDENKYKYINGVLDKL